MTLCTDLSLKALWPKLLAGSTLVTVNRRTARFLASGYAAAMQREGSLVWETPDILPYSAWLRRWLDQAEAPGRSRASQPLPILLEPHQQRLLWERIIEDSRPEDQFSGLSETAGAAMEAWEILQTWQISLEALRIEALEDSAVFLDWAEVYSQHLEENTWLDPACLAEWLAAGMLRGDFNVPAELIFAGFEEWTPQQAKLLEVLAVRGCCLACLDMPARNGPAVSISLTDREEEAQIASQWIRSCLETDPEQRIGLIVPDLQARRQEICRTLDAALQPETLLSDNLAGQRAYNLSLGEPLTEQPVVRAGFLLLEAADGPMDIDRAGELLRTPFIAGGDNESSQRAGLDALIRRRGTLRVSLEDLRTASREEGEAGSAPVLADALDRSLVRIDQWPARQLPSRWVQSFQELLAAMGWPGERSLSSSEYQTLLSWRDVLGRLAELDRFAGRTTFCQALRHLRQLAREAVFQPGQPELPVQVLGLLEPAGEQFDRLWILGMHSEIWPPRPEPNPLLPTSLQRRLNTPHASAERELDFARKVTRRLLDSADQVVVSYPEREADRQLCISPLFSELPACGAETLGTEQTLDYWLEIMGSAVTETLADHYGPPLERQIDPGGGTGLIKAQSDCPFRAFAVYRLGAEPLPSPMIGLNAAERGTLVHLALHHVWRVLGGQEALLALDPSEKAELVRAAAEKAVASLARRKPQAFSPRFRRLESDRLQEVLQEWLDVEAGRPPFSVQGLEQRQSVHLFGLTLTISTDRIDRLRDGRMVVLDYKTGRCRLAEWFGERIAEPQLPLYALANREPIDAVAFARVRKGESRFLGVAVEDSLLPGAIGVERIDAAHGLSSWPDLLEFWQSGLHGLIREVLEGYAAVSPNDSACTSCDLQPLCRRDEIPGANLDAEEPPDHAAD